MILRHQRKLKAKSLKGVHLAWVAELRRRIHSTSAALTSLGDIESRYAVRVFFLVILDSFIACAGNRHKKVQDEVSCLREEQELLRIDLDAANEKWVEVGLLVETAKETVKELETSLRLQKRTVESVQSDLSRRKEESLVATLLREGGLEEHEFETSFALPLTSNERGAKDEEDVSGSRQQLLVASSSIDDSLTFLKEAQRLEKQIEMLQSQRVECGGASAESLKLCETTLRECQHNIARRVENRRYNVYIVGTILDSVML